MAQHSWIYADNKGSQYDIGLYHGKESGHVLIHCNTNIMVIDFNILEDKTYSFYLGEEFLELIITKIPVNQYTYELKINKEVHTPHNLAQEKVQMKYNMISIGLGLFIIVSILIATWWVRQ